MILHIPHASRLVEGYVKLIDEKKNLDAVLAETEQLLRNTYGFGKLRAGTDTSARQKADALLEATKSYARKIAENPGLATLADSTGFAPEGVASALAGLGRLEHKLNPTDWEPTSLFGDSSSSRLPHLIGIMMRIPEIGRSLSEISSGGLGQSYIADMTRAWVEGSSIHEIAQRFFEGESDTNAITKTCKAIYKVLTNCGPWGLSALSKMGLDISRLSEDQKQRLNSMPAMIYHGVKSEAAVLMRMNSVPRSIAESLGAEFEKNIGAPASDQTVGIARQFLRGLTTSEWELAKPSGAILSGGDYKEVWSRLSGEL